MTAILAPLRGVTVKSFRAAFAREIKAARFCESVTPFITAVQGYDPLKDRELSSEGEEPVPVVPQFIGKDPAALEHCLERIKDAGYDRADLNCGCPFPMVRKKFRGSGIMKTPDILAKMTETGVKIMGKGRFSVKMRLGVDSPGEILSVLPVLNRFPLKWITVHARTAKQMYSGVCDMAAFDAAVAASSNKVIYNGDATFPPETARSGTAGTMIGRSFVIHLGTLENIRDLLERYAEISIRELCGDRPALGRLKELASYWKELPGWKRRWPVLKISRTVGEFLSAASLF